MKARILLDLLNEVYDTVLLGFIVKDSKVQKLQNDLFEFLKPFKPEKPHENHISIAYVMKNSLNDDLIDVLEDAKHYNITFEAVSLSLLPGVHAPADFLVLKLKPSASFFDLINSIKEVAELKEMPGGFKSHLSLMKFPKGAIKNLEKEIETQKVFEPFTIKPDSIALWNERAEISKQVELR